MKPTFDYKRWADIVLGSGVPPAPRLRVDLLYASGAIYCPLKGTVRRGIFRRLMRRVWPW